MRDRSSILGGLLRVILRAGLRRSARKVAIHEGKVEPTLGFEPRTCCLRINGLRAPVRPKVGDPFTLEGC